MTWAANTESVGASSVDEPDAGLTAAEAARRLPKASERRGRGTGRSSLSIVLVNVFAVFNVRGASRISAGAHQTRDRASIQVRAGLNGARRAFNGVVEFYWGRDWATTSRRSRGI